MALPVSRDKVERSGVPRNTPKFCFCPLTVGLSFGTCHNNLVGKKSFFRGSVPRPRKDLRISPALRAQEAISIGNAGPHPPPLCSGSPECTWVAFLFLGGLARDLDRLEV